MRRRKNYVPLATLQARDSGGEHLGDWPTGENLVRIRLFPPARAQKVWHVVLRIRHAEGTTLWTRLGGSALSFGYMQILVPEDGRRIVGWRSPWGWLAVWDAASRYVRAGRRGVDV